MTEKQYLTIEEIQSRMLTMMKDIKRFAAENNLTFVLTGGSALGAVRHHDFIPWDDDADLGLPRDQYEFFVANYQPQIPNTELLFFNTKGDWNYPYARVADTQTLADNEYRTVENGVFVDVFPIDHMADDKRTQKIEYVTQKMLDIARNLSRKNRWQEDEPGLWWKKIIAPIVRLAPASYYVKRENERAKKIDRKHRNSKTTGLLTVIGVNGMKEFGQASWYDDIIWIDFADTQMPVMQNYDDYLTFLYKDYRQIPAEADRKHHWGMYYR